PANWNTQTMPSAGDSLIFPFGSNATNGTVNDLPPGMTIASIVFDGPTPNETITLTGNAVVLTGYIQNNGNQSGLWYFPSVGARALNGITMGQSKQNHNIIGDLDISSPFNVNGSAIFVSAETVTGPVPFFHGPVSLNGEIHGETYFSGSVTL